MAPSTFTTAFPSGKTVPQPQPMGAGVRLRSDRPHPAVARIVVPEQGATAYGSGTLIDVRDNFGLVITNWHVVRDATGTIEVLFPGGFTSKARALKVDADWDLAALVIWRPSIEPVSIAAAAPQPGELLTICGYGQGNYRCATGRCTKYYAPRLDFPRQMVELDVEARQGDSGGPIFNRRGELAGVLFGAGQGTTLGSFGGRVGAFLATLAPDIGRAEESLVAEEGVAEERVEEPARQVATLRDR
ncbi:MAG: trypsin-like peptidase domain-containing protein, partial [Planctomycetes bacterium]|nr:trypsin-like peptidase domain-containing protein [Planctomycetota bacterium]